MVLRMMRLVPLILLITSAVVQQAHPASLPRENITVTYGGENGTGPAVIPHNETQKIVRRNLYCHLHPVDGEIYQKIVNKVDGDSLKLLEYHINFPEYESSPLKVGKSGHYRSDNWHRIFDNHGEALLNLVFNYQILSLTLLKFGTDAFDIDVVDSPARCFGDLSGDEQHDRLKELVMHDFHVDPNHENLTHPVFLHDDLWQTLGDKACYKAIDIGGKTEFIFRCCRRTLGTSRIECASLEKSVWAVALHQLFSVLKVLFWLFSPVLLYKLFLRDTVPRLHYWIDLNGWFPRRVIIRRIEKQEARELAKGQRKPYGNSQEYQNFKNTLENPGSDGVYEVKKICLDVDHDKLITEKDVPASPISYLLALFVRCGIRKVNPFATCCKTRIFGTWSNNFLWINRNNEEGEEKEQRTEGWCTWLAILRFCGSTILFLLLPSPFYVRFACYYIWEEEEFVHRKEVMKAMNQSLTHVFTPQTQLIQYLSPTHSFYLAVYAGYLGSGILLYLIRLRDHRHFDSDIKEVLNDLKNINRVACVRLIVSYVILPLEKFGCIGLVISLLYSIIALPVCLIVSLVYCIPILYLTFRILFTHRFEILKSQKDAKGSAKISVRECDKNSILSYGVNSVESALLMNDISPKLSTTIYPKYDIPKLWNRCSTAQNCGQKCVIFGRMVLELIRRLLVIAFIYSVLLLYAEVFSFILRVVVLTLMGGIVNANKTAQFIILGFYILGYTWKCYGDAYKQYVILTEEIFANIKTRIGDKIKEVALRPKSKQKDTAFCYYTEKDLNEYYKKLEEQDDETAESEKKLDGQRDVTTGTVRFDGDTRLTIELDYDVQECTETKRIYIDERCLDKFLLKDELLMWRSNSMVMFLDADDNPRIPEKLFFALTQFEGPGCPGPVYKSLLGATLNLFYMAVFFIFVVFVIINFSSIHKMSNTNQMLATVAGGFLPFIIRTVLNPLSSSKVDLNNYRFESQMHEILTKFNQKWPVHDLTLRKVSGGDMVDSASMDNDHDKNIYVRTIGRDWQKSAQKMMKKLCEEDTYHPMSIRGVGEAESERDFKIKIRDQFYKDTRTGNKVYQDPNQGEQPQRGTRDVNLVCNYFIRREKSKQPKNDNNNTQEMEPQYQTITSIRSGSTPYHPHSRYSLASPTSTFGRTRSKSCCELSPKLNARSCCADVKDELKSRSQYHVDTSQGYPLPNSSGGPVSEKEPETHERGPSYFNLTATTDTGNVSPTESKVPHSPGESSSSTHEPPHYKETIKVPPVGIEDVAQAKKLASKVPRSQLPLPTAKNGAP